MLYNLFQKKKKIQQQIKNDYYQKYANILKILYRDQQTQGQNLNRFVFAIPLTIKLLLSCAFIKQNQLRGQMAPLKEDQLNFFVVTISLNNVKGTEMHLLHINALANGISVRRIQQLDLKVMKGQKYKEKQDQVGSLK
ncbi:hypothetical protein TTHERM_00759180 (macronuclear) [Tetrahymena thermophila SB210]|uniref:Uncharacterized protein n=1 Tax=Tetrahymena thermophila (strain SB210) TaxID=312017 RepID=Q23JI7_TETTS|nr:hypothetical protein TTHERM_00759180 [Tetrahymena thermophila SB210]EAR96756.2 hypothetical protein TTHERM_00759180 [Tetrahymena thermophila SB210]|eukprot:XP_001017001.2 hypothetical protein TTHERM_00759180 [Tetrahymena thermophila SB210]